MVSIIRPTNRAVPVSPLTRRDREAQAVESHVDEKREEEQTRIELSDRRKGRDRRRQIDGKRRLYDLRSGTDRRRNSNQRHSIEIEV